MHCHTCLLPLLLLLSAANGMRLQLHPTRRAVLVSPMVVALPQAASAETLRDSAIPEQDLRANGANKDPYWIDHAPVLSQPAATPTFVTIDLVAPDDSVQSTCG